MTPFHLLSAMYNANLAAFKELAVASKSEPSAIAAPGTDSGNAPAKQPAQLCIDASYGSACWLADDVQDGDAANEPLQEHALPRKHKRAA